MHRLCALILLFSAAALALPGQVETQFGALSMSGVPAADFQNTGQHVSSISQTMIMKTPTLLHDSLTVSESVTNMQNDYSSVMLMDHEGKLTPLSNQFNGNEVTQEVTAEYKVKAHTASVAFGSMVTEQSPYPYRSYAANYNYGFFSGTTVTGLSYNWYRQDQPLTYFTDPRDFHIGTRPLELTAQRFEVWVEQTMSDRWKSQIRLSEGQRFEDRPADGGLEFRNAVAVAPRVFLRLDVGSILEDRSQPLKDERGYYSLYWTELQATYEIVYDLLVTASAGTVVEREDVAWEGVENQVGTDSYGLKVDYKGRGWSATLGALVSTSNTSYRSHAFQGGFIWEI